MRAARFLISAKFWLPIAALAAVELAFRFGAWQPLARPDSYAGTSLSAQRAAREIGLDRITGITLGDSRTVYGFDHATLHRALSSKAGHHLSLAMGGTHLAGFRAVSDWALERMPRLQRVIVGVAPHSMTRMGNGSYEIALVEPWRAFRHYHTLAPHFPPESGDLRSLGSVSALMAWREDIVNFAADPKGRLKDLERPVPPPLERLTFANARTADLCPFQLDSLAHCRDALADLQNSGRGAEPAARTFAAYCQRPRHPLSRDRLHSGLEPWLDWLTALSRRVAVVVVLMPEHPLLQVAEDRDAVRAALEKLHTSGTIRLVDQTGVFPEPHCRWFSDLVHANQAGAERATARLLESLDTAAR